MFVRLEDNGEGSRELSLCRIRTERFGVSMPAVTTRLVRTKQDIRHGRKTGCPVSAFLSSAKDPRKV